MPRNSSHGVIRLILLETLLPLGAYFQLHERIQMTGSFLRIIKYERRSAELLIGRENFRKDDRRDEWKPPLNAIISHPMDFRIFHAPHAQRLFPNEFKTSKSRGPVCTTSFVIVARTIDVATILLGNVTTWPFVFAISNVLDRLTSCKLLTPVIDDGPILILLCSRTWIQLTYFICSCYLSLPF